jgi:hypothetical protein
MDGGMLCCCELSVPALILSSPAPGNLAGTLAAAAARHQAALPTLPPLPT